MVQGGRCTILKLVLIVVIVIAVDQTFRKRVLLSPGEVVEKYMIKVGLHIEEGSSEEFPVRVRRHCEERRERHEAQQYYFYIKSKIEGRKNLLLCVPPRMASKQAFDLLSQIYDGPCPDGRLRSCAVEPQFQPDNNTLTAVLVRHPFDRLIIDYKHQKYSTEPRVDGETHIPGRKILFSRHRARQGRRKNKREFREFIKSQVLSDNSSIYSVSQICNVCSRHYDISIKLDEGQEKIEKLLTLLGHDKEKSILSKPKIFSQKLQRKYFAEITAEEMEKLVAKFKSDFLIFGYTFEKYKKALEN